MVDGVCVAGEIEQSGISPCQQVIVMIYKSIVYTVVELRKKYMHKLILGVKPPDSLISTYPCILLGILE